MPDGQASWSGWPHGAEMAFETPKNSYIDFDPPMPVRLRPAPILREEREDK